MLSLLLLMEESRKVIMSKARAMELGTSNSQLKTMSLHTGVIKSIAMIEKKARNMVRLRPTTKGFSKQPDLKGQLLKHIMKMVSKKDSARSHLLMEESKKVT